MGFEAGLMIGCGLVLGVAAGVWVLVNLFDTDPRDWWRERP